MLPVKSIPLRTQLWLAGLGYAGVFVFSACVLYARHLQEINNPAEAAGGMFAFGQLILYIFIAGLFMIPTVFLVWVMARFEPLYTAYSKLLLGLSLTAPACLSLFVFGKSHLTESVLGYCLYRLAASPFVIVTAGVSRLVARFDRAKKLTSCALLVEALTLGIAVALFIRG
jgi:hypothetical protein